MGSVQTWYIHALHLVLFALRKSKPRADCATPRTVVSNSRVLGSNRSLFSSIGDFPLQVLKTPTLATVQASYTLESRRSTRYSGVT
jgi:hypothetical protein